MKYVNSDFLTSNYKHLMGIDRIRYPHIDKFITPDYLFIKDNYVMELGFHNIAIISGDIFQGTAWHFPELDRLNEQCLDWDTDANLDYDDVMLLVYDEFRKIALNWGW